MADLRARIHGAVPQIRADLERLVAIPSVSARDFDPEPLRRSADTVAELLREVGAETKILRSAGHPAVVGYVKAPPGKPRSEERRVGKECRSTWTRNYYKKHV